MSGFLGKAMRRPSAAAIFKPPFVKAAVSIAVLCLIFSFVPISHVLDALQGADSSWVAAGIILLISLRVITACRMQIIAKSQGLKTNWLMMMRIVYSSTLYNLLAPGALAGGAVTYLKYRQQGIRPAAAVANIYTNKSIELLVVALSAPLFWLIDKDFPLSLIAGYVLLMVVGFSLAFALLFGRFAVVNRLGAKMMSNGQSLVHRAVTALCRQVGKIGRISYRTIFVLVVFSAMHSLFSALAALCLGKALGVELGLVSLIWMHSVVYLLGMLPISISNLGVREAGMIMLMVPYGVSMTEATTWSVLMYSGPLSCALIGLLVEAEHLWLGKRALVVVDAVDRQCAEESVFLSQGRSDDDSSS